MKGLVIKNTGSGYRVRTEAGQEFDCKIKGNFRIKGIKSTNPVAVGDWVDFNEAGLIHNIHDRRNYVVRKPANLSKQLHVIAANVDQVLLVITLKNPETPLAFIDRFIASTEAYQIPTIIAVNKVDLLDEEEQDYLDAFIHLYSSIGYPCVPTSFTNEKVWSSSSLSFKARPLSFPAIRVLGNRLSSIIWFLMPVRVYQTYPPPIIRECTPPPSQKCMTSIQTPT